MVVFICVWHCLAKVKTPCWICGVPKPLPGGSSSTNWKCVAWNSLETDSIAYRVAPLLKREFLPDQTSSCLSPPASAPSAAQGWTSRCPRWRHGSPPQRWPEFIIVSQTTELAEQEMTWGAKFGQDWDLFCRWPVAALFQRTITRFKAWHLAQLRHKQIYKFISRSRWSC